MKISPEASPSGGATFRQLFEEYAPFVWRALRHMGVPDREVPDLCQEVFLVVHRKLGEFDGRSSLRTWIYGICFRTASEHRRRAHVRREEMTESIPDEGMPPPQPEELLRKQARELLQRALSSLDEEKRAVLVLFELEGLPMTEVAEVVGCPLSTAYSRLYAARKHCEDVFRTAPHERRPR
ncbi:sigma-70 family RNA polymerase sigma factor [Sorangium sp. So ce1078]